MSKTHQTPKLRKDRSTKEACDTVEAPAKMDLADLFDKLRMQSLTYHAQWKRKRIPLSQ